MPRRPGQCSKWYQLVFHAFVVFIHLIISMIIHKRFVGIEAQSITRLKMPFYSVAGTSWSLKQLYLLLIIKAAWQLRQEKPIGSLPSPLISCLILSRFRSSAIAFSICWRDWSCSPFSSSADPTVLHKLGKDAIPKLGSWQSCDGEFTRMGGWQRRGEYQRSPSHEGIILGINPDNIQHTGLFCSATENSGEKHGNSSDLRLLCDSKRRLPSDLEEISWKCKGNTPYTSCKAE